MKKLINLLPPFTISYLFSAYINNTIDFTKFPSETKYVTFFTCIVIYAILYVVTGEIYKENVRLNEQIKNLNNKK